MASTSSREAALERRKALTTGGKKAAGRFSSSPGRVRTAADALPSRTEASAPAAVSARAVSAPAASPQVRSRPARSLAAPASSGSPQRSKARPIANPSRELVLARREALSKAGKRADRSKDRTRTDLPPQRAAAAATSPAASGDKPCTCKGQRGAAASAASATPAALLSLAAPSASSRSNGRSSNPKRAAQYNPSRALVLARREALSKRGKSASTPTSTAAASVARQGNPDLSSRELSQKVRELKSKVGSAGSCRNGGTRPCGPNLHGSKQGAGSDASLKVGVSETARGQVVTGTQANRSTKTTGNEAATCRAITGTEYLGAEVFQTFCQSEAPSRQPAKVRVSATSHGNSVTGNEVGRSEKVTGDEPGTCKTVTGTEYISANQAVAYCGTTTPTPRKVG
ncbi:MAG: CsoS2 family carboxysome shell protein, partial [Prochlorococcaceae cyanobacterium]